MMMSLFKSKAFLKPIKTNFKTAFSNSVAERLPQTSSFHTLLNKPKASSMVSFSRQNGLFSAYLQTRPIHYQHIEESRLNRIAQLFHINRSDIRSAWINPNDHLVIELRREVVNAAKIRGFMTHAAESSGDIEYYYHTYAQADLQSIIIYDESVPEFLNYLDDQRGVKAADESCADHSFKHK